MVRIEFPFPPTSNNAYAVVRGRKILSAAGRKFHADAAAVILAAGSPRVDGERFEATLEVYPPDRRRRDALNSEKLVTDAAVKAKVIPDDCLIDKYTIIRRHVVAGGKVVLTLKLYEGEP